MAIVAWALTNAVTATDNGGALKVQLDFYVIIFKVSYNFGKLEKNRIQLELAHKNFLARGTEKKGPKSQKWRK